MVVRVRRRRPAGRFHLRWAAGGFNFYIYFLIILQKYTTVSKFYSIDNYSPWPTAVSGLTVMGHSGAEVAVGYGGGRRRLQCPHGGMKPPCNRRDPRRLHVVNRRRPRRLVFLINERKHTHLQWHVGC
jgi:hypothetical protein